MATNNSLNNRSAPFTVTSGDLTITSGNIKLPNTTNTPTGQIQFNTQRFVHNYGSGNCFVGTLAGNTTLTTASALNNTAVGLSSLTALTTGTENSCYGDRSGTAITSGSNNTAVGSIAGLALTTGGNNTLIGYSAGSNYTGAETNNCILGFNITGTVGESNIIRIGNSSNTTAYIQGNVLKPATCAFMAYLGTAVANATGNGATYTLGSLTTALTEVFDQGSNFNPGNGAGTAATFTAPVTGKYFLTYQLGFTLVTAGTGYTLNMITSNRTYQMAFIKSAGACRYEINVLADMDAGDTVTYTAVATGEAGDIQSIAGGATLVTFVSGYLAC